MPFPSLVTPQPARASRPHPTGAPAGRASDRGRVRLMARLMVGLMAGTVALVTAVAALPAIAAAQFATGLTPPPPKAPAEEVAKAESVVVAARDSVAREQRLDMKAWVDSAAASLQSGGAAVAPIPVTAGDTAPRPAPVRPPEPVPPAEPAPVRPLPPVPPAPVRPPPLPPSSPSSSSPGFRPGAPAPDTATPLPLLALLGAGLLGSGLNLLRRKS